MRKRILVAVFMMFVMTILLLPEQAKANGNEIGRLSKENPCVYHQFTMKEGEEFYGCFFNVDDDASKVKLSLERFTDEGISVKIIFSDLSKEGFINNTIKELSLEKNQKEITVSIRDFKAGEWFFIEFNEPDFSGKKEIQLGLSVYSEDLGGKKHDFNNIVLSKDKLELTKGDSTSLKAKINGKTLKKSEVVWSTSDKKVATVSKNGKVTAKGNGTAIISCTLKKDKKFTTECVVYVVKPNISLSQKKINIDQGESSLINAVVVPEGAKIKWTSSNEDVVKVDKNGKCTGVSAGTAKITCSLATNKKTKAVCKVTVTSKNNIDEELFAKTKTILARTCDPLYQRQQGMNPKSKYGEIWPIWSVSLHANSSINYITAYEMDSTDVIGLTYCMYSKPAITLSKYEGSYVRDSLLDGSYDFENDPSGVIIGWSMFDTNTSKDELEKRINGKITDELFEKLNKSYTSYKAVIIYGKNADGVLTGRYAGFVDYSGAKTISYSLYGVASDNAGSYGELISGKISY